MSMVTFLQRFYYVNFCGCCLIVFFLYIFRLIDWSASNGVDCRSNVASHGDHDMSIMSGRFQEPENAALRSLVLSPVP